MLGEFTVNVEVVGTCNLTCPSCPVGNYGKERSLGNVGGTMPVERFRAVLAWIDQHLAPRYDDVFLGLYSWGEPLIHPQLAELIGLTRDAGFRVGLSSNLNHARRLEEIIRAEPDEFVISLSGFEQATYVQSHRGGNIERVKENMTELSRLIQVHRAKTEVVVHYHTYRHNSGNDITAMAALCEQLAFHFSPSVAYFMPVEKVLAAAGGRVSDADRPIVENLLIPLEEQIQVARAAHTPADTCELKTQRLDVDVDGAVKLCCSSFERKHNVAASLFDLDFEDIQQKRHTSALCKPCMKHGVYRIFTRKDYDVSIARANSTLAELGREMRFGPGGLAAGASGTEPAQVNQMLEALNAGRLDDAWPMRLALRALLAQKYGLEEPLAQAIEARIRCGNVRRGRDIPWDPARLLFADAVFLRNHRSDCTGAHELLVEIERMLELLESDMSYRATIVAMRPIVAAWLALPGGMLKAG